jgi:hypothetical protein
MKSLRAGQLVTVTDDSGTVDAIISDTSHMPKVVVVALDEEGNAAFRDTQIAKLRPRHDAGPDDATLRQLISAASAADRAGAPGSGGNVLKGRPAHSGPRMHRPTGRGA